jgi:hypothetical protein
MPEDKNSTMAGTPNDVKPTPAKEIAPNIHSPDAVSDLKSLHEAERSRKMYRKSSVWKDKQMWKDPLQRWTLLPEGLRKWKDLEPRRHIRPHMTMHVKGGWQIQLEDGGVGAELETETDWVAEIEDRPGKKEVLLTEILKPGKPQKARGKGTGSRGHSYWAGLIVVCDAAGDFEVIPATQSVITLDDYTIPEPEVNEPWEYLDYDSDYSGAGRATQHNLSYAEAVAHAS